MKNNNNSDVIKFDFQGDLEKIWKESDRPDIYLKSPAPDWTGQLWKGLR